MAGCNVMSGCSGFLLSPVFYMLIARYFCGMSSYLRLQTERQNNILCPSEAGKVITSLAIHVNKDFCFSVPFSDVKRIKKLCY